MHSSIGNYTTIHYMLPPVAVKHSESQDLSEELKKVVSIPVINVGRYIASTNRKASVFEMTGELCAKTEGSVKRFLFEYLDNKGGDTYTNAKVLELKDHAVVIEKEGKTEEIGGFTDIVIAVGGKSENPLEEKL